MNLFKSPDIYLATITYSRHGGKYYPEGPKSNSHKGNKVSNQFAQRVSVVYDKENCIKNLVKDFIEEFPNASNIKVESFIKL